VRKFGSDNLAELFGKFPFFRRRGVYEFLWFLPYFVVVNLSNI